MSAFLRDDATFAAIAAGDVPAGVVHTFISSFSRDISLTSALAITGVGFKPKAVVWLVGSSPSSGKWAGIGFDNGATAAMLEGDLTDSLWFPGSVGIVRQNAGNYQTFLISSMDADGFTIGWTKTGTPTGTATILFMAIA